MIRTLLAALPHDLPAVVAIVLHRGVHGIGLAKSFSEVGALPIVEPVDATPATPGRVYLAPPDVHMRFQAGCIHLDHEAKVHYTRPAVDPLFVSAAAEYGPRVCGVILSGNGRDGVAGLTAVHAKGGLAIAQRPAENASMPESAIREDHVDAVLDVDDIGRALVELARGRAFELADLAS